jgi:hypothetical protein
MMGSKALYKETQLCVILGFTENAIADGDLRALDKNGINSFKTSIYCTDPIKQKALVMFLSDKDNSDTIPLVKAVDIHQLIPTNHTLKSNSDKNILYDKNVLKSVMEIIKIDVDDKTPLVIRQA